MFAKGTENSSRISDFSDPSQRFSPGGVLLAQATITADSTSDLFAIEDMIDSPGLIDWVSSHCRDYCWSLKWHVFSVD
jgi:hypothetical protein